MDKANIGKARWARGRAEDMRRQARELDRQRDGDWRARARRQRGVAALLKEAMRFKRLASRFGPEEGDQAA